MKEAVNFAFNMIYEMNPYRWMQQGRQRSFLCYQKVDTLVLVPRIDDLGYNLEISDRSFYEPLRYQGMATCQMGVALTHAKILGNFKQHPPTHSNPIS